MRNSFFFFAFLSETIFIVTIRKKSNLSYIHRIRYNQHCFCCYKCILKMPSHRNVFNQAFWITGLNSAKTFPDIHKKYLILKNRIAKHVVECLECSLSVHEIWFRIPSMADLKEIPWCIRPGELTPMWGTWKLLHRLWVNLCCGSCSKDVSGCASNK